MKPKNNKIIVRVDSNQKNNIQVGGIDFLLAKQYNHNNREKNPVVCEVVTGNNQIKPGTFLLVHHTRFVEYSAYELGGGLYALPYDRSLFARIDEDGNARSLCKNIIAERVEKKSSIDVAVSYRKNYNDRVVVLNDGYGYKKGDEIFTLPFSDYEIVYVWKGVERRVVKVFVEDICGKLVK
jgi:hypothetical protein